MENKMPLEIPHEKALKVAREICAYRGPESDPEGVLQFIASILLAQREEAVEEARAEIERAAKVEALKWVVEPIEVGIVTGHPTYLKIKCIESRIRDLESGR
jgi:hypothetical protein